jgi:hypothetical protein
MGIGKLKLSSFILAQVTVFCVAVAPARGEVVLLARDGKPTAAIVVAGDADEHLQEAAESLASYIHRLCGVAVPVHDDGAQIAGVGLYVGGCQPSIEADLPAVDGMSPIAGREAFAIRVRDGQVYFAGRTNAAVTYAVYAFIERELGVRWFAPGDLWEHVLAGEAGELAVDVHPRVVAPATPLRIWSGHGWYESWKQWDRRNRAQSRTMPVRHRMGNQLQGAFPVEQFGQTHPEYYPLIGGKRFVPPLGPLGRHELFWPCSSNPQVAEVAADFVRRWFDESPDERRSFSMGMDDVTNICECEPCRALDQPGAFEKQQFSDRNYAFVNAVARRVKQTHPDHYIGALIYRQMRQPPVKVTKMEDNVYGFVTQNCATWWADGVESDDKALTRDWARRFVLPLGRYEYYGLGTFTPRFYPHTMSRQIQFDRELGFEAQYTELYTFLPHTAPMIWSFAKLQWDAALDIDELLGEFYVTMFEGAAGTMGEYYDLLERAWNTPRPQRSGDMLVVSRNRSEQMLAISPDEIHQGLALLDQALSETDDAKVRQRIAIVRDALIFSQLGIESGLLNQRLRAKQIASSYDAEQIVDDLKRYAQMAVERDRVWAVARRRDDLLGETVRGLGDIKKYLVIDEFAQLDTNVVSVAMDVLDWYRAHDRSQAAKVHAALLAVDWPQTVGDVIRAALTTPDGENLLANADLEASGSTQADHAKDDWTDQGAPDHWSIWIRSNPSDQNTSGVEIRQGVGRNRSRGLVYESGQGGALIQSISAKPGESYLATTWLRGDGQAVTAANLYIAFRDDEGSLFGPDRRQHANTVFGVATDRWQRLVMHVVVPPRAVSLVMMLGAHPFETPGRHIVFDDATLHRVSEAASSSDNLLVDGGFDDGGEGAWSIRDWGERKGVVSLERADESRSGQAARVCLADAENIVIEPTFAKAVRGRRHLRFSCWVKQSRPGGIYISVITRGRDGSQLQYLNSSPHAPAGAWSELTYEFTTDAMTHKLNLYLRPNADGILLDDASLTIFDTPEGSDQE